LTYWQKKGIIYIYLSDISYSVGDHKVSREKKKSKSKSGSGVKKSKLHYLMISTIVLLVIMIFVLIGTFLYDFLTLNNLMPSKNKNDLNIEKNLVVIDITNQSGNYLPEEIDGVKDHDVKMNSSWIFKKGKTVSSNAFVSNPSVNKNSLYFEVFLADSDTKILTSPVLVPGSHMENIALDKELSVGTHRCIIKYTLLGSDGESSVGTLQLELKIIVSA